MQKTLTNLAESIILQVYFTIHSLEYDSLI